MLVERFFSIDHTTIYRWVQRFAPEMEKRLRWYWRNPSDLCPWHIDETYVKVNGRWAYLYRAVDSRVELLIFTSHHALTATSPTGSGVKSLLTSRNGRSRALLTRIRRPPTVVRLLCLNAKIDELIRWLSAARSHFPSVFPV
jgi:transposase-like protein